MALLCVFAQKPVNFASDTGIYFHSYIMVFASVYMYGVGFQRSVAHPRAFEEAELGSADDLHWLLISKLISELYFGSQS